MTHTPPDGLGTAGVKLWNSITDGVIFRPDELAILESACKMADRIARYERELEGEPTTVRGSMGQMVLHPLLAEITNLQVKQAQLLSRLKVPELEDEEDETAHDRPMSRSEAARIAANARWRRNG